MTQDIRQQLQGAGSSVVALDLNNAEALVVAAEMAGQMAPVAQGLQIAQQLRMQLLFVAVAQGRNGAICVPVQDMTRVPEALHMLHEQLAKIPGKTAWVILPESLRQHLLVHIHKLWGDHPVH